MNVASSEPLVGGAVNQAGSSRRKERSTVAVLAIVAVISGAGLAIAFRTIIFTADSIPYIATGATLPLAGESRCRMAVSYPRSWEPPLVIGHLDIR